MRTDDFDFDLPRSLIAQVPASPRDSARLLEVNGGLHDRVIADLPDLLAPGDLMLLNDTRVIPARLRGKRGTATVEITLHRRLDDGGWRAFARPAKRLNRGDRIDFGPSFHADVTEKHAAGEITVVPNLNGEIFSRALREHGAVPLPPYIKRPDGPAADDSDRYQTVYARVDGAVAAPTAGLHFTDRLFAALDARGVRRATVTLHVGAGTFLPVTAEMAADHRMHPERGVVTAGTARAINETRAAGNRVVCIGTTSLRLIESAAAPDGHVSPFEGETNIFILPGYEFRVPDLLLTNFHLPRSTLFMLVSAFSGLERMKAAYAHAVRQGYRFYSYGDACLLHRREGV
jgi:S-adenosylmethionine:tRNA ribosyltransferase-isomerase